MTPPVSPHTEFGADHTISAAEAAVAAAAAAAAPTEKVCWVRPIQRNPDIVVVVAAAANMKSSSAEKGEFGYRVVAAAATAAAAAAAAADTVAVASREFHSLAVAPNAVKGFPAAALLLPLWCTYTRPAIETIPAEMIHVRSRWYAAAAAAAVAAAVAAAAVLVHAKTSGLLGAAPYATAASAPAAVAAVAAVAASRWGCPPLASRRFGCS